MCFVLYCEFLSQYVTPTCKYININVLCYICSEFTLRSQKRTTTLGMKKATNYIVDAMSETRTNIRCLGASYLLFKGRLNFRA
jgi:hypothetical protein